MQHKQRPPPSRRISKPLLKSAYGTTARLYLSINTFIDQSGFRLLWYFSFERDSVENKGAKLVKCQATKMWEVKYIFLEVSSSKYDFRYNALRVFPIKKTHQGISAKCLLLLPFSSRQNLKENVTFTFFFLVLPQISLVKYYETIMILMQIFVYFKLHFHNEGLDCQKNYFEMFFCDRPLLSSWKISALTV